MGNRRHLVYYIMFEKWVHFCNEHNLTTEQTKSVMVELHNTLDEKRAYHYDWIAGSARNSMVQVMKDYGLMKNDN